MKRERMAKTIIMMKRGKKTANAMRAKPDGVDIDVSESRYQGVSRLGGGPVQFVLHKYYDVKRGGKKHEENDENKKGI